MDPIASTLTITSPRRPAPDVTSVIAGRNTVISAPLVFIREKYVIAADGVVDTTTLGGRSLTVDNFDVTAPFGNVIFFESPQSLHHAHIFKLF
jgi:hypothetical protein